MRRLGLTLALLTACSHENTHFGVFDSQGGETADPATTADSSTTPTTSSPSSPSTPSTTSSTDDPDPTTTATTEGVDVTGGSTTTSSTTDSPDTDTPLSTTTATTTDPDDTTGDPPFVCEAVIKPLPSDRVTIGESNSDFFNTCPTLQASFKGPVEMDAGVLRLHAGSCTMPGGIQYVYGGPYPVIQDRTFCGRIVVSWADTDDGSCRIGAMRVEQIDADENLVAPRYFLYHSPLPAPPMFPPFPEVDPVGSCGCPPDNDDCCEFEPGYHDLVVDGKHIPILQTVPVDDTALWTNMNATVEPQCVMSGETVLKLDWFLERTGD